MEVISIDGIEYVRASQLARKYRYTSDYIGQLCRSGKVEAKLVGRTWYVNPDSVEGHKQGRYQKVSAGEKTSIAKAKIESSRVNVEAVPRADTFKSIKRLASDSPQYLRRIEWKPVKYEVDDSELLPPLKSAPKPIDIPIEMAEASTVRIRQTTGQTTLEAEPLPTVALRGSLKIASIDDDFAIADDGNNTLENIDISSLDREVADTDAVHLHPSSSDRKRSVEITLAQEESEETSVPAVVIDEEDRFTYDVPVSINRGSFAPKRILQRGRIENEQPSESDSGASMTIRTYSLLLGLFVLLTLAIAGVSIEQMVTPPDVSLTYSFDLNF